MVCYEAGCFGYEPARRMQALGTEVYLIAPQDWDEQGKRQVNDKLDAQVMCRRLSEYLAGHRKALSVVRNPSPEEEARRAQGRMREQLRRQIRRMEAMGRSLLLQREMAVSGRWWKGLDGLMQAVRRGRVDVAVCFKLDRLGRSLSYLAQLIDEFSAHKVALVVPA